MDRFPIIITLGAALLGWVAGEMAVTDPIDKPWVDRNAAFLHWGAPLAGALVVVVVGKWLAARALAERAAAMPPVAVVPASVTDAVPPPAARRRRIAGGRAGGAPRDRRCASSCASADVQVHLINVQRPLPGDVTSFVGGKPVEEYHRERSDQALAPARALLEAAGVPFEEHQLVGIPGPTIARVAHETGCHLIVMGARGLGSHVGAVVGSVAQATLEHASVPVLMVK